MLIPMKSKKGVKGFLRAYDNGGLLNEVISFTLSKDAKKQFKSYVKSTGLNQSECLRIMVYDKIGINIGQSNESEQGQI
jgi:hypothetical protein